MRVDFLGLEAFISIAEFGSFRRAAAHLNLSQTAISHRMRKLEESLGASLFNREKRQVALTRAGADLLPQARILLGDFEKHLDVVRDRYRERNNHVALACLPTVAFERLPPVLGRFRRLHPDATVRIHDTSAAEIGELVASGAADIGVTILAANRWDLTSEPLFTEDYLAVTRRDHAFAQRREVTWADLEKEPLIRVSQQTGNRIIIDEALGARSERLRWVYEAHHTFTALELVRQDIGVAITPRLAVDPARYEDLATVVITRPRVTRTVGIVRRRDGSGSPLVQELHRQLKAALGAAPARAAR
jgi:DNA-binding transcriptional LysR family regulator